MNRLIDGQTLFYRCEDVFKTIFLAVSKKKNRTKNNRRNHKKLIRDLKDLAITGGGRATSRGAGIKTSLLGFEIVIIASASAIDEPFA